MTKLHFLENMIKRINFSHEESNNTFIGILKRFLRSAVHALKNTCIPILDLYCHGLFISELKILARWAPAIVNHLYWPIFTCGGNGKELVERFTSLQHHVVNKHHFPNNVLYKKCDHASLSEDQTRKKEWLRMGSEAHENIIRVLSERIHLGYLEQMTEQVNTTMLEVFHAVKIGYLPKKTCFSIDKMIAGTQIAGSLDHNHNVNRKQMSITEILFDFARIEINNKQNTETI